MEIDLTEQHPDGAVETDTWDVRDGLTVERSFGMAFSGCGRERYTMLVNVDPVDGDDPLRPGGRVYIRPFRRPGA